MKMSIPSLVCATKQRWHSSTRRQQVSLSTDCSQGQQGLVITQQVDKSDAGPRLSQKVRSVGQGQNQGGTRPGTDRTAAQLLL